MMPPVLDNEYLESREKNITRNNALLKSLGMDSPQKKTKKSTTRKRKFEEEGVQPIRKSSRRKTEAINYNEDLPEKTLNNPNDVDYSESEASSSDQDPEFYYFTKVKIKDKKAVELGKADENGIYHVRMPLPSRCEVTNCFVFDDYPEFRPNMSPSEVLEQGAFGGTYWRPIYSSVTKKKYKNAWKEFPEEWFSNIDIEKQLLKSWESYDKNINKYKVKCGGDLDMWQSSGWIRGMDPYGWFQWYCRFFLGRRSSDDQRQISRGLGVMGPKGRFRNNLIGKISRAKTNVDDVKISPVIRQSLHHWGYTLTLRDANKYCKLKGLSMIKR